MTSNIHLLIIFLFTLISSAIFGQSTNGMRMPISVYADGNVGTVNKELVIFQYFGHFLMKNEPDLFVQEVSDFVELYN